MRCFAGVFVYLLILLLIKINSVNAEVFTYDQALAKCYELNLEVQKPAEDGRVYTLNKMGSSALVVNYKNRYYLEAGTDVVSKFLAFGKGKKILEIGGTYGDLMIIALKQNKNTMYVLNDLDERHLFIAAKCLSGKIKQDSLDKSIADQAIFVSGDIAKSSNFQNLGQFDAIYVGKVFHFLTPEQLELTVKHIFLLLKPGGRVYVVAFSPHFKYFERFIPEYKRRMQSGEKYPGFMQNPREFVDIDPSTSPAIASVLDRSLLALEPHTLSETFKNNGFQIVECKLAPLSHKSKLLESGKEIVILIAKKISHSE